MKARLRHPIRSITEPFGRVVIVLPIVALAFLLLPAAQAFAGSGTGRVEIEGTGTGEVVDGSEFGGTPALACSYVSPGPATGTCENELAESSFGLNGERFEAVPAAGSEFVEWTVVEGLFEPEFGGEHNCGSAARCLVFSESSAGAGPSEHVVVKAKFDLKPLRSLTVILGGQGTVTSNPAGISCSSPAEECSANFAEGEEVTLEANAAPGSTFAGWIGCKHVTANTCRVTMSEAREVSAVFLKEGTAGQPGQDGRSILVGTATAAECPEAGITVEIAGEPSTRQSICNGANGTNGTNGTNGEKGAAGPQGPEGRQGPQGPAGHVTVTCKVKQKGNKAKVTCTVKQLAGASSVHWRLSRRGRVYRRGMASHGRLNLGSLAGGRYQLQVQGSMAPTTIVVG